MLFPFRRSILTVPVIALALFSAGCGSGSGTTPSTGGGAPAGTSATGTSGTVSPTAGVAGTVRAVYRSETAAVATYANVVKALGHLRPFTNVLASEEIHVATLSSLMGAHGISVPAAASGQASPPTRSLACALGARTEEDLIALYNQSLPRVSAYPDMTRVFQTLRDASARSHLPAFQHCS